jgi:Flp pilus assembly protein TadD
MIAFNRKDYSRAAQLLTESSAHSPTDAEAFYCLGMAHFHLKQTVLSRAALERAVSLDPQAAFVAQARQTLAQLN